MHQPKDLAEDSSAVHVSRVLLHRRWMAVVSLGLVSLTAGLVEAAFLILVTRTAFALSADTTNVHIWATTTMSTTSVLLIALTLVLVRLGLGIMISYQSARLSTSVTADLRTELSDAFFQATWAAQHGGRPGRLQELLTTYASQGAAFMNSLSASIVASLNLLALVCTAAVIDPITSIAVIAAVLLLGMALRPMRSAVRRQGSRSAKFGMEFATSLSEVSELGMEMHVFSIQSQLRQRNTGLIHRSERANRRLTTLRSLIPTLYAALAYLSLVGALGAMAALGSGSLTSVGTVMLVMLRSLSYGQIIQTSSGSIHATVPYIRTLSVEARQFIDAKMVDGEEPVQSVGEVRAQNVSFHYIEGRPILRNVSFSIAPGEVIGIVGPSGSGKSTLVQLILGLRVPNSGSMTSAGRDIQGLSRTEWSRRVTFVPQDPTLVAGSIADNVRFLRDDVDQATVERATRLAHLHDDVVGWPEGYDRAVGERGSQLSGGQRQRLVIARALVEEPDLLILDEPTSALDVRSEALVRETLHGLRGKTTILIIAHRMSTLSICDRIMVVLNGEIKAFDSPEELESSSEFYREAMTLSGLL